MDEENLINGSIATTVLAFNATKQLIPDTRLSFLWHIFLTKAYFLGLIGNVLALCFLFGCSKARPPRNAKHSLMLVSLATNDLGSVVGMWILMEIKQYLPEIARSKGYCMARVLWRAFGLGSGSIVIVMAVERWLALTRPFCYQKYVTVGTIRRSIIILWLWVLILSSLPLFGFGLYWKNGTCARYKVGKAPMERAYAYLYMSYVGVLCICLVYCNFGVIRALVRTKSTVTRGRDGRNVLVRRISRNKDLATSANTVEEIAFARVMGLLCAVFYFCWVPQLISIPLWHIMPESRITNSITFMADLFLLLHFSVDPYFYVLQRWQIFRSLLCRTNSVNRNSSTKTAHELVTL